MVARTIQEKPIATTQYKSTGSGVQSGGMRAVKGQLYTGPDWFTSQANKTEYGRGITRQ
jgi:hypothetical protein